MSVRSNGTAYRRLRRTESIRYWGRKKLRGCIYARFSTRFQHSIGDQVRVCSEWAEKNDVEVKELHVFSDEAATGKTQNRAGMTAVLAALAGDEVDVVITFATNRIYRKMYRSLQFVEEEILDRRKRCVFVAQNIDTEKTEFWRHLMQVFAMLDEVQVQLLGGQVRAAHEGLLLKKLIHGTLTFGYYGREVPGPLTRLGKPRREWAINADLAPWVVQVFRWFVDEGRLGYSQIARRLRNASVQPPPRVGKWTWRAVKHLLANRRYIGDFSYGLNEAIWQNKAGYSRNFRREQPRMVHWDESLRIVDDALFLAAQERVATYKGKGGRKRRGNEGYDADHLLKDLLFCPEHDRPLGICGAHGGSMACPDCKRQDVQTLFSMANRKLIQKLLCEELARRIQQDPDLVRLVVEAAQRQVQELQAPDPTKLQSLERDKKTIGERIGFIFDNPGEGQTDRDENGRRLAKLRAERSIIEGQIAELQKGSRKERMDPPSEQQARELLQDLAGILERAAASDDAETVEKAKGIIIELTGGRIMMSQQGEPRPQGGWLRGTFTLRAVQTLLARSGGGPAQEQQGVEVAIDFRDLDEPERLADQAKVLYDQGLLIKKIASELKTTRNLAAAALQHWFTSRGLEMPDGRSRRSDLAVKHLEQPLYQRLAEEVKRRCDDGQLLQDIARDLSCDRNTITQAFSFWYESWELTAPDGRARRKTLAVKTSKSGAADGAAAAPRNAP